MLKLLWQPQLLLFLPFRKIIFCRSVPDSEGGSVCNTDYSENKLENIVLYSLKNHTD